MSDCEFHGYDKLTCPECKRNDAQRRSDGIAAGRLVYAVFEWRGDGRYTIDHVVGCKTYKRNASAQKVADALNSQPLPTIDHRGYVVRLLAVRPGELNANGTVNMGAYRAKEAS